MRTECPIKSHWSQLRWTTRIPKEQSSWPPIPDKHHDPWWKGSACQRTWRRGGFSHSLIRSAIIRHSSDKVYVSAWKSMTIQFYTQSIAKRAKATALLDSGATKNFMNLGYAWWLHLPIKQLSQPQPLYNVDRSENESGWLIFYTDLQVQTRQQTTNLRFFLSDLGEHKAILGYPWFTAFQPHVNWKRGWIDTTQLLIIFSAPNAAKAKYTHRLQKHQCSQREQYFIRRVTLAAPVKSSPSKIPEEYQWHHKVFSKEQSQRLPGHSIWDHAIKLLPGVPNSLPGWLLLLTLEEKVEIHKFVQEHPNWGMIHISKSPYTANFFFVKKKDGKLWPVQDYCPLNKWTKKNKNVSPLINQIINCLSGCLLFTTVDIRWGYNNIWIKEGDEWKAAFLTPEGLFEPTVMFFGLMNSPATFQTMMNTIFCQEVGEGWLSIYMDNMAIHTAKLPHKSEEQHVQQHRAYVHRVLMKLEENDLYLKPEKCEFKKEEITYLGVIVGKNHLKMSPKKLQGIADWPVPKTPTNIWWFLGFTSYYCYFVPNYSSIAWPLLDLTKKTTPWHWGEQQFKVFKELKTQMCSSPILAQLNFDKRFILQVDTLAYGMVAILSQEGDPTNLTPNLAWWTKPTLHPVAYYSATFTATEWNHNIYEWELLTVMKALAHWRPYLGWTKVLFIIWTDHTNLQYLKSPRNLNRHTAQWHTDLQEYDYQLEYIPGKTNTVVDALSQPADIDQGQQDNKDVTILAQQICILHTSKGQVIVPNVKELKRAIVSKAHDTPTAGHPGRDKTLWKVQHDYWWVGMKKWIEDYIKGCAICQQTKIQTHKWHTPMYQIPTTPNMLPFQTVAMDLITELPNRWGFNAILTIIDHGCSRAAVFLPCTTNISGPGIAQLYLDNIYQWFGLPTKIISDRDPHFTSHFRKVITKKLGIQQNLSTMFHPQMDGLSEWKNQWVEQYLHTITALYPEDWSYWITVALAVHNNWINSTMGLSPNQVLFGYSPHLTPSEVIKMDNEAVEKQVKWMMEAWDWVIKTINQKAGKIPSAQFAIRDQVWLEGTYLKLPHQATKLAPKRYRPFMITKQINPVTYQLTLPTTWQIHPVFHVSLLSPYRETDAHGLNYSRPPPDLISGEEFYEVEQIRDHQCHGWSRTLQYLIKWKGSPESDNTWEPADLVITPDLLKEYHKHRPLSGIKANQLSLQYSPHPPWIPQNSPASSTLSCKLPPLLPTNFMSLSCALALTKTSCAPLHIAAAHTSPINMPSSMPSSVKNTTVAIIPEDHLLCQLWICLAANPLLQSHPLHPCPFQCTSHPLNRPLTASQDILASARMMPFKWARSPRRVQELLLPPLTPGDSPSLPPLCRMSSLPHLIHPWTNSGPLLLGLLPPSGSETMSIGRRSKDSRLTLWYFNRGWMMKMMASVSAHQGMRKTGSTSPISQSLLMTEWSGSPASLSSSTMEGSLGSTAELRERRRRESLNCMPPQTTLLTNPWNCYPPGSTIASGATERHMPSSRTPSTTLTTGDSSPTCINTGSTIRSAPTLPRSSSFWKQIIKVPSRIVPSSRSTSLWLNSLTGSSISPFDHLQGPFSWHGKGGACSSHCDSSPTRDKDVSM